MIPYVQGHKKIPLPTYFILGSENDECTELFNLDNSPNGGYVARNLTYLGRSGITNVCGLRVAYLSGTYKGIWFRDRADGYRRRKYESHYIKEDVDLILQNNEPCDILLTCEWGRGFDTFLDVSELPSGMELGKVGSQIAQDICSHVMSQYHFAGQEGLYFALPPFRNNSMISRFYGLGNVGDKKNKNLFAFSLVPVADKHDNNSTISMQDGMTNCPYNSQRPVPKPKITKKRSESQQKLLSVTKKPKFSINEDEPAFNRWGLTSEQLSSGKIPGSGYICRICNVPGHFIDDCPYGTKKHRKNNHSESGSSENCWFCLGASDAENNLLITIGKKLYVAIDKGPLTNGHCLILPINHLSSSHALSSDVTTELTQYKHAFNRYFNSRNPTQWALFFERHIPTRAAQHLNLNAIPIPKRISIGSAKKTITDRALVEGFSFEEFASTSDAMATLGEEDSYLLIDLNESIILLHRVNRENRIRGLFDFGREITASILGCPGRANWRSCVMKDNEEEEKAVATLRKDFLSYLSGNE